MLVDDEEDVIRAMMKKIDWEGLGFGMPGYAHNGIEALELAETEQPDVVMTDIRMPYMDGLELARELKRRYPEVRILILSGFDEFEYAKEAIRVEAEEYLLKPVNAEEMRNVFARIHESLDRELEEKRNIQLLQSYYQESLPLMQENLYVSLIERSIPEAELSQYIKDYRITLSGPYYIVSVIHVSQRKVPEGIEPVLLTVSVRRLAEEKLRSKWRPKVFSYRGNTVVISQLEREDEVIEFTDSSEVFCRMAQRITGATVTIGIGCICSKLTDISRSYSGAREAVSYRTLYGTGKAININEITPKSDWQDSAMQEDWLHDVFRGIRTDTPEVLDAAVGQYLERRLPELQTLEQYHYFLMEMISSLYRFAVSHHLNATEIFGEISTAYSRLEQMDAAELRSWLGGCCRNMQDMMKEGRNDVSKSFVLRAEEFIRDHYPDPDLTVDVISAELGLSSAYFSTIFKKETGRTPIGYLTDLRMEQARHLLIESDEKTYVIAGQVGYADPNYFSYVFKKYFGTSPSRYRTAWQDPR